MIMSLSAYDVVAIIGPVKELAGDEAWNAALALLGGPASAAEPPKPIRRGGISERQRELLAGRNARLRDLHRSIRDWRDLPLLQVAREIDTGARRYEAGRWPRERLWAGPPQYEPAATFWQILQSGARVPGVKQLIQILGMEVQ
ncbi:hypothetical protein [Mesorhizobium sp. KR1-2]|uniref:hypothetical protein n=1 Tax=Mesorhizobium sp. KR1-2 TaxID=3156609 RepID=UPI0032B39125